MKGNISKIERKGRTDGIRARHRADVMQRVLETPGIDRTRLAEATGLTNAAMTRIVQELNSAGLVQDAGLLETVGENALVFGRGTGPEHGPRHGPGRGRKRSGLEINAGGGYVLGLSILAFNSGVAMSDISGRVIEIVQVEPSNISNPVTTLDEISKVAIALMDKHDLEPHRVFGAGVAIAGYLDRSGHILNSSPYLGWPVFDIRESLAQRLRLNVVIDNANRCIAIAENRTGSCIGIDEMILIRAAVGIGGAVICNGEVVRGDNNRAGHIGHSCVEPNGLQCSCGAKGCLNTVASGWAILNQLGLIESGDLEVGDLRSQEAKLRLVLSSNAKNNEGYQAVIRKAGELLAKHCVGLLHSMASHSVVLTGPLGRNETYCNGFSRALEKYNIDIRILAAYEHTISGTAEAASVFALIKHVYTPSFDIQPLLANASADNVSRAGGLVL
ncbi:MAG: putative NBD/HSP70 family sugar kinase [Granulosicoccus sp.]|jgi:predicted NBD/HSP70 family sugar kinase